MRVAADDDDPSCPWREIGLVFFIFKKVEIGVGAGSVSFKKKKVTIQATRENVAGMAQARK